MSLLTRTLSFSAGQNAIIKVSQEEVLYPNKRDSVRIQTNDAYDIGSVWTFDVDHVPSGCSVWGALWSQAKDWPSGGEIDTWEAVNLMEYNQVCFASSIAIGGICTKFLGIAPPKFLTASFGNGRWRCTPRLVAKLKILRAPTNTRRRC